MSKLSWTEAECQILREDYTQGGTAVCIGLLPGRSKKAIHYKAAALGLQGKRGARDQGKGYAVR